MVSYFDIILRVITSPNSAFAEIRDNENKYFVSSIGILIFTSILIILPFIMISFDDSYFAGVDDADFPPNEIDLIFFIGSGVLSGIISAVLLYFIGKKLGGNNNWKKVFSVIFYAYIPAIPFYIVISGLLFLMMATFPGIDPSFFQTLDGDEDEILSMMGPALGYMGILALVTIAFVIWIFIISVKAIKTLNGFSTAKAFGLLILVLFIQSIVTIPFGL